MINKNIFRGMYMLIRRKGLTSYGLYIKMKIPPAGRPLEFFFFLNIHFYPRIKFASYHISPNCSLPLQSCTQDITQWKKMKTEFNFNHHCVCDDGGTLLTSKKKKLIKRA